MDHRQSKRLPSQHPHSLHFRSAALPGRASDGPCHWRDFLRLMAFTMAAAILVAPSIAQASLLQFTFAPGSSTVLGTSTEAISGGFTVDTMLNAVTISDVTLSGDAPFAEIFSVTRFGPSDPSTGLLSLSTSVGDDFITFQVNGGLPTNGTNNLSSFSFTTPERLTQGNCVSSSLSSKCTDSQPNASVSSVSVPAPIAGAGIPGLLAGVGALLFWRGRSAAMALVGRRHRSSQPVAA
jgi:hypothetical protein